LDERIIIRHLNLGKANQTEEFRVSQFKELTIGRDSTCEIKYDPDRDDLVSRRHTKIMIDKTDPIEFSILDLGSRNGTFVNKQRISTSVKLQPGDIVQFGAGGPEFQFDVEPRPGGVARPTRLGTDIPPAFPPTREAGIPGLPHTGGAGFIGGPPPPPGMGGPPPGYPPSTVPPPTGYGHPGTVGKATVERMIVQTKQQTRNTALLVGLAILFVVALAGGGFWYLQMQKEKVAEEKNKQLNNVINNTVSTVGTMKEILNPQQIAEKYSDSVVLIEVSWKLIDVRTGQQLNQVYVRNEIENAKGQKVEIVDGAPRILPVFIDIGNGLEPILSTSEAFSNHAVGFSGSGSGFVVSADGFILTNRHVASAWETSYTFPEQYGLVVKAGERGFEPKSFIKEGDIPRRWVPSQAHVVIEGEFALGNARVRYKPLGGKAIEGRNVYCDVTFKNNRIRNQARLVRASDRIDVAMVKVDLPRTVKETSLYDNYSKVRPGEAVTVMGYPAVSPEVVAVTNSKDVFNRNTNQTVIPDPTISQGIIGRVLRDGDANTSNEGTFSLMGDVYQLTVNSTGAGNSGGPVFDDHGRVIGIYTSGSQTLSFAVPIKYGMELMGVK
jgi:S1-C subfamily serine protease